MEYYKDLNSLKLNNTIVTLGKFDGNHKGHRLLFNTAVKLKTGSEKVVVFTFDINPRSIINDNALRTITSHDEKAVLYRSDNKSAGLYGCDGAAESVYPEGVDIVVEFPFNKETMSMEPHDFVKNILIDKLGAKAIVVGKDFRFGKNRKGSVETLKEFGSKYGFTVYAMDKLTFQPSDYDEPQEISSSLIKEEILKGNMEDVNAMLGEPFCITGEVLHGKHLGNTIGFPTINQAVPQDKILPPDGVYATKTLVNGKYYMSITNVGKRPSFQDGEHRNVETNIFDFDADVYGACLRVNFYKFIRSERVFGSIEELKKEIEKNKQQVLEYFRQSDNQNKEI